MRACYVCGGYLYRGARHRTCEPGYRRARFNACSVCGKLARGERHKSCAAGITELRACSYCGAATKGKFHKRCQPIGLDTFAIFADTPYVVQRRCLGCGDWFPFAAVDGHEAGTTDAWSPKGKSHDKRPVFGSKCRACIAEVRRNRVRGLTTPAERHEMSELHGSGTTQGDIAKRFGVSRRTVIRQLQKERAA